MARKQCMRDVGQFLDCQFAAAGEQSRRGSEGAAKMQHAGAGAKKDLEYEESLRVCSS